MHLCLLVDKKQITLAKDILESLQEDGLLFFMDFFCGYFDLHIGKQLKKQLIQI